MGCWLLWHLCLPIWLLVVMEPGSTNLVVSCYGTWVYQFGCLPHTHCSDAPSFCEVLTALHQSWRYRNNVVHIVYNVDMYKEVDNYRCLARYSRSTTTTNQPASRAPNEPAWPICAKESIFLGKNGRFWAKCPNYFVREQKWW